MLRSRAARVALAPLALAAPPLRLALTTPHASRGDGAAPASRTASGLEALCMPAGRPCGKPVGIYASRPPGGMLAGASILYCVPN